MPWRMGATWGLSSSSSRFPLIQGEQWQRVGHAWAALEASSGPEHRFLKRPCVGGSVCYGFIDLIQVELGHLAVVQSQDLTAVTAGTDPIQHHPAAAAQRR